MARTLDTPPTRRAGAPRSGLGARSLPRARTTLLLAAPFALTIALWLLAGSLSVRFISPAGVLRQLGLLAAHLGATAFALNLLLGARLAAVDRAFGGLDRMYRAHRSLGYALPGLLLAHALLMLASYAVFSPLAALALITPGQDWRVFAGVLGFLVLVAFVVAPIVAPLKHEAFVRLHKLVGLSFLLATIHYLSVAGLKGSSDLVGSYLVALTAIGTGAFVYRAVLGRHLVRRHHYRVAAVNPLGSTAVELLLAPERAPLRFEPGQFVFITVLDPAVPAEAHPFSITSSPDDPKLRLVVKALGDYTRALQGLPAGARALIEGPYGGFSYRVHDGASGSPQAGERAAPSRSPLRRLPAVLTAAGVKNRRQIWIAGGVGVTPFLSMARSLGDAAYDVDLYYATERAEDAFFIDELYELADRNPRIRVIPVLKASLGRITADDIHTVSPNLPEVDILVCGPPAMMSNLRRQFVALGVPEQSIHFEDFGALSR